MTVDEFVEQNPIQKNDWFAAIYGTPAATPPEDLPELPDGSSSSSSGFESSSSSQNSSETSNGEISTPLDYEDGSSSGAESTQGGT